MDVEKRKGEETVPLEEVIERLKKTGKKNV